MKENKLFLFILLAFIGLSLWGSVARVERIKKIAQGKEKVYIPKRW